ncbi:hypothetical protein Tco_0752108 [Tanacetum coccineum]|uniref:Uncharacterized protein n=1 Tax=Tanacetum coccineum TaxID=301880 RepID=A0ABQ4Z8P3_9ASTR
MGDKHLDTIPETESDEFIKSSVSFKEHSEIIVNSYDDNSSSDDDSPYGEDIDYVDALSPDVEIVSLEVVEIVNPEFPPADRSDFNHEEFADELTHIMSLPNLECFKFKIEPDPGDLTSIDLDFPDCEDSRACSIPQDPTPPWLISRAYKLFKQGSSIADLDKDDNVTLVDETQERQDDELMFDTGVLDADEMPVDDDVTLVDETQERQDDELMFDTGVLDADEMLVEAKVDEKDEQSTKLNDSTAGEAVTTASVEDSAAPTTIEEITLAQTLTPQEVQPSISKDKGKGIIIDPEVPLKRKDQIALDEQIARDIQAKVDAKLIEEQQLARKQEEEANIALIESWENTQAMMETDRLLVERLQSKEREELTDEEKGKLFMELMEKRRKHFAALKAQEKRNRPPTKAQKRTQISTYLKHMGRYTYKQLKGKSFDEIQKLFDKEMKRVNTFVAMGSEVQESKKKKVEGSKETAKGSRKKMLGRKRVGKEQQQESLKKQKVKKENESDTVDEYDEAELKKLLVIKNDEDIAIDAIPLATKLPVIINYKLHKEGMLVHYQLIRADGSSKRYSSMIRMLQEIDREDLEALWRIVKAKYGDTRPDNEFKRVLWGDLKVYERFECIFLKYDEDFERRNLKIQKMNIKFRGGLLGLKRLHGFLEVTAAQVHNGNYAKWFGINKWYQSFALRNFDLEDMELESTNSGPTAKLPILKLGEYEMWAIRIKQYFQIQDYALWEVIENEINIAAKRKTVDDDYHPASGFTQFRDLRTIGRSSGQPEL